MDEHVCPTFPTTPLPYVLIRDMFLSAMIRAVTRTYSHCCFDSIVSPGFQSPGYPWTRSLSLTWWFLLEYSLCWGEGWNVGGVGGSLVWCWLEVRHASGVGWPAASDSRQCPVAHAVRATHGSPLCCAWWMMLREECWLACAMSCWHDDVSIRWPCAKVVDRQVLHRLDEHRSQSAVSS